jgi:glycosyltransferase involved in cell wall biosynthesis
LRVVAEPQLGEWRARVRGLDEAQYEFIAFVDDDNWVAPDWIQQLSKIMTAEPAIGACGSMLAPVFEITPPNWFERYQVHYGILPSAQGARRQISLCAAGMGLRAAAWQELVANGFRGHLTGRIGQQLWGGSDTELCFALKLAGWELVVDDRLQVKHYLPRERLTWSYLRRLVTASAYAAVALDGYYFAWQRADRVRESWAWAFASGARQLLMSHKLSKVLISRLHSAEGDDEVILIDKKFARLKALLSLRRRYTAIRREVREAGWRKKDRLL